MCFMRLAGDSFLKVGDPKGPPIPGIPGAETPVETGMPSLQAPTIRGNKGRLTNECFQRQLLNFQLTFQL